MIKFNTIIASMKTVKESGNRIYSIILITKKIKNNTNAYKFVFLFI